LAPAARGKAATVTDDFLSPDDHTPPGEDTEERLAEDVGLDATPDDEDDDDDVEGSEHRGPTPPG
jgi:hypothetical protein